MVKASMAKAPMVKGGNETMNRQNDEAMNTSNVLLSGRRFQSETYAGEFNDIARGQRGGLRQGRIVDLDPITPPQVL